MYNNIFKSLDLFGTKVAIRYNQNENFNTNCGGFITSLLGIVLLFYVFNIIQILYSHGSAQVIQETKYVDIQQKFPLTSDKFSFVISLTDIYYKTFIDERIYTLKVTQRVITRSYNKTTGLYDQKIQNYPLIMERCTKDHFQIKETIDFFLQKPYPDSYCFSKQNNDVSLEGYYNSITFRGLEIEVKQCEGSNCADPQVIKQRLDNCYLNFQFSDRNIISTNFEQPFQPIGKGLFYIGGTQLSKTINMFLLPTNVHTYSGIFSQDSTTDTTLTFSSERESVINRSSSRIFLVQISLDPHKELNYYRKYLSLSSALSQIGGIYNVLFALGCFICKPYNQLKYKRNLINSVFGFQYQDNSNQENQQINQEQSQDNNINNIKNINLDQTITKNNNNEDDDNKIDEIISQENNNNNNNSLKNEFQTKSKTNTQIRNISIHSNNNDVNQSNTSEQNSGFHLFKKKPIKKEQDLQQSIQFSEKMNKKELKKTQNQLKSFFKQTFEELKLNTIDYIKYYVNYFRCKKKKKSQIIEYSLQKLYSHLDICYILNKLIEFEKFKKLLLDDDQIKLFEYIPKPIIKIDKYSQEIIQISSDEIDKTGILLFDQNKTLLQKSEEAQNAYNNIISKEQFKKNKLDEKLINLLHPKLITLFKDHTFEKVESNSEKIYKLNPRKTIFAPQASQYSPQLINHSLRDTSPQLTKNQIKEMYSPFTFKINIDDNLNENKIDKIHDEFNEACFEGNHIDEKDHKLEQLFYQPKNYNSNFSTIVNKNKNNHHHNNKIAVSLNNIS